MYLPYNGGWCIKGGGRNLHTIFENSFNNWVGEPIIISQYFKLKYTLEKENSTKFEYENDLSWLSYLPTYYSFTITLCDMNQLLDPLSPPLIATSGTKPNKW